MEVIKHATDWATGDALQGKVLLGLSVTLSITSILILRGENTILKGTLIPTALVILLGFGYGGFLAFTRSGHLQNVKDVYAQNPQQAIDQELEKAMRDDKAYSTIKKVWPVLIALAGLMFLFVRTEYLKGLSIALVGLFLFGLIIDTLLHQRLEPYLQALRQWKQ